jgi:hypothetical protein
MQADQGDRYSQEQSAAQTRKHHWMLNTGQCNQDADQAVKDYPEDQPFRSHRLPPNTAPDAAIDAPADQGHENQGDHRGRRHWHIPSGKQKGICASRKSVANAQVRAHHNSRTIAALNDALLLRWGRA